MCILELRKVLIYKFCYDHIRKTCGNNSRLSFTDTDSLKYEIKTGDVYEDFGNDEEMFDFSNYLIKSRHCNDSNKLVVGKMKEKTVGVTIEEFVGLKPKMYSLLVDDNTKRKKQRWE